MWSKLTDYWDCWLQGELTNRTILQADRCEKRWHWHAEIWESPQGGSAWQSLCFCCNYPLHHPQTISALWYAPCLPINLLSFATFCWPFAGRKKLKKHPANPRATKGSPCHVRMLLISACHEGAPETVKTLKSYTPPPTMNLGTFSPRHVLCKCLSGAKKQQ